MRASLRGNLRPSGPAGPEGRDGDPKQWLDESVVIMAVMDEGEGRMT